MVKILALTVFLVLVLYSTSLNQIDALQLRHSLGEPKLAVPAAHTLV